MAGLRADFLAGGRVPQPDLAVPRQEPSPTADATVRPSRDQASASTRVYCCSRVRRCRPEATSHSLTRPSRPPVASVWPSGAKATATVPVLSGDALVT